MDWESAHLPLFSIYREEISTLLMRFFPEKLQKRW